MFQDPERTERLCKALAEKARAAFGKIEVVVSPAVGAIIPGYETARHLGARAMFVEREKGEFQLRRGFEIKPGERVLMVEDVVTTGLSSRECLAAIRDQGELVGAACLIDRSDGKADIGGMKLVSLAASRSAVLCRRQIAAGTGGDAGDQAGQPRLGGMKHAPAPLGVNIDHVATIRNARGDAYPDPVRAAVAALDAGADGITAHLREDRRHISDDDIDRLSAMLRERGRPLNLEMAVTSEMLEIALHHRPHAVCLVPERREERTTEGGLDVAGGHNWIAPFVEKLRASRQPRIAVHRRRSAADRSGQPHRRGRR